MVAKNWHINQAIVLLALLILIACDSQRAPVTDQLVLDGSNVSVPLPQRLRTASKIDPEALRGTVTINGVETELQIDATGQFTGQIEVPAQSEIAVQIEFTELFSGQLLTLGRAEKSLITSTDNTVLTLLPEDYDFDSFDFDGDSASNLLERQFNTNPLNSSQLPDLVEIEVIAELPVTFIAAGFDNYQIVAELGNNTRVVDASVGQFRESFRVVRQEDLTVSLRLVEGVTGQELTVGELSRQVDQDNGLVIIEGATWNLEFDQDADGLSDSDELIAGTDPLNNPLSVPFSITFDVPVEITNIESAFALLEVDGQAIELSRLEDTYTASVTAQSGATVAIEAEIRGSHQDTSVLLANFSGETVVEENATVELEDFSTDHDTDNDGISNITELEQGTDPFDAELQCTVVTETIFATLTEDAFVQNSQIFNDARLLVDADRSVSLIRFQYDQDAGQVTDASLNLTVGADPGTGLITVFAVSDFQWSDESQSLVVPSGQPAGNAENLWALGLDFSFTLNPVLITDDVTLVLRQSSGNDVAFQSSATTRPPTLELTVERCE